MASIRKKVCPKCGHDRFCVTAHVTQGWKVDGLGNFLKCINECEEVTHGPDDDDIWVCNKCGYDAPGREMYPKEGEAS